MTAIFILICLFFFSLGVVLATIYHKGIVADAVKLSTEYQIALAFAKSDLRLAEAKLKDYHTAVCIPANPQSIKR